ncbi:hypothetical protein BDZ45DRAFT_581911, partial [Acephala macrosclerotiorum]
VGILNYALTLEHLEHKFYREGLANYTQADFIAANFADPFYDNLKRISSDETEHVTFLTTALGDTAVEERTYSFPSTDPQSFVALASVLEGVGGLPRCRCLYPAGSILTVESRHSAYIRSELNTSPFPQPFDDLLTFNEVYTLAAGFIVSCPSANAAKLMLPLKAFPTISLGTTGRIDSGQTITLETPGYVLAPADEHTPIYAAFITVTEPIYADAVACEDGFTTVVLEGVNGQSYVVLTACKDSVTDDTVAAGPAIVEVTNPYPIVAA